MAIYQFSPISTENEGPEDCGQKEEDSQREENSWQRDFSGRQEAAHVFLHDVDGKVGLGHKIPVVWIVAVVVEQRV